MEELSPLLLAEAISLVVAQWEHHIAYSSQDNFKFVTVCSLGLENVVIDN